jgi:hypothetical protein
MMLECYLGNKAHVLVTKTYSVWVTYKNRLVGLKRKERASNLDRKTSSLNT